MVAYLRVETGGFLELAAMRDLASHAGVQVDLFDAIHTGLEKLFPYPHVLDPERLLGSISSSNLTLSGMLAHPRRDEYLISLSRLAGWKLQGTDGVRALVSTNRCSRHDSLKQFLHDRTISADFCSLYAEAFVRLVKANQPTMDLKVIAIAEDGRDHFARTGMKDGLIHGLCAGGVTVDDLGIVPTPFLAAYGLAHGIPAIMLTASHNPAAYNGIKLFVDGRKLYPDGPAGEYCLSWQVAELASQPESTSTPEVSAQIHVNHVPLMRERAMQLLDTALVRKFPVHLLQGAPLLLDAANGAYSEIAQDYLRSKGIPIVPIACTPAAGAINQECGVAELESLPPEINFDATLPGTVRALFSAGRSSFASRIYAVVLDGDGDRGFLLEYRKQSDTVLIYDGDELGYLLALDMKDHAPLDVLPTESESPLIFNCTMESDITLAQTLREQAQATVNITCVGDRYLLEHVPSDTQNYVGCEKSGHVIVPVTITEEKPGEPGVVRLFSGNGLLTVLRALPRVLAAHSDGKDILRISRGHRLQFTIRNRPLERFHRDSSCWNSITKLVESTLKWTTRQQIFQQEPDMLYYDVYDSHAGIIGRWYMRKSGTEPKISVCLWIDPVNKESATLVMRQLEGMIPDMLL
jgi:phosphoglucosamine mutase